MSIDRHPASARVTPAGTCLHGKCPCLFAYQTSATLGDRADREAGNPLARVSTETQLAVSEGPWSMVWGLAAGENSVARLARDIARR